METKEKVLHVLEQCPFCRDIRSYRATSEVIQFNFDGARIYIFLHDDDNTFELEDTEEVLGSGELTYENIIQALQEIGI